MVDSSGEFHLNNTGFTSAPDLKYYNKYTYDSNYNSYRRGKLGDSIKETLVNFEDSNNGGWYTDYTYFTYLEFSLFARGGGYDNTSVAGIFSFSNGNGSGYDLLSTRAILTP